MQSGYSESQLNQTSNSLSRTQTFYLVKRDWPDNPRYVHITDSILEISRIPELVPRPHFDTF